MSGAQAGRARVVVVGDALLDRDVHGSATRLAPDAPVPVIDEEEVRVRPGGAGLAAALAAADGAAVTLVTALGDDAAGRELAGALRAAGVEVVDLGLQGSTPEKVRVHAAGRPVVRLDRGGRPGARIGPVSAAARAAVGWAQVVLVSDYGRGVAAEPGLRTVLARAARDVPLVWDPHPRGPEPVAGAAVCTPNDAEARAALPGADPGEDGAGAAGRRAGALARRWGAGAVCVTRGADGAVLGTPDAPPVVLAAGVVHGDPCGAGDRFASRLAAALADGAHPAEAARLAVAAATAFVAGGGAGGYAPARAAARPQPTGVPRTPGQPGPWAHAAAVADRIRAAGGTVVATGGCFDLLHAGHVATLRAARALGDGLVVLLNDDASVARLKGPERPLNRATDRATVLEALGCVDAVAVFGEDTPAEALRAIRPQVWAKGGDYAGRELPEAAVLRGWGGRVTILPHLPGRSTTRLIQEATCRRAV